MQGATIEEARKNLTEAVALVLDANRVMAEESLEGAAVIREPFVLTAVRNASIYSTFRRCGCGFLREVKDHTVYVKRSARKSSSIPRHREVNDFLERKICSDSQIPRP